MFDYHDEFEARRILWQAVTNCRSEAGMRTLFAAIRYLEKSRPADFTQFVKMGAN